jgi:hypothetical protein
MIKELKIAVSERKDLKLEKDNQKKYDESV